MINLNSLLVFKEIENLGYYTGYAYLPVPDIIDFNWKNILNAPPSNTSKTTINELNKISIASRNRSKIELELVKTIDQNPDLYFIDLCNQYQVEYPMGSIKQFYNIIKPLILNIKGLWNRPRPAQLAKYFDIPIDVYVTDTHQTASYPSGHTVYSSLVANIIKYIYPQINQTKLDKIVFDTGKARIMQGVHYPSDNVASIVFSKFVFKKLYKQVI